MKNTIMYNIHKESGAVFSDLGGYKMPLFYKSQKLEHLNVVNNVGLFDMSNKSILNLKGDDSTNLINSSFSRDISTLNIGQLIYGLFLNKSNFVIDNAIVYKLNNFDYLMVVTPSMADIIINFFKTFNYREYIIYDYTDLVIKFDLQGPKSLALLEKIYGSDLFDSFPYYTFKGDFRHKGILISRSGYTGEFGFELFLDKSQAVTLWRILLKEGEEFNILPCGLSARDSLILGSDFPLSQRDIGNWEFCNNPWTFAVDIPVKSKSSYTYAYVGYDSQNLHENRGIVLLKDKVIGEVLICLVEFSITRYLNNIYSITSAELPSDNNIEGLIAGYIKVDRELLIGAHLVLSDKKKFVEVEVIRNIDLRPNRTVKKSIKSMRLMYE